MAGGLTLRGKVARCHSCKVSELCSEMLAAGKTELHGGFCYACTRGRKHTFGFRYSCLQLILFGRHSVGRFEQPAELAFWKDFVSSMLDRILEHVVPDAVFMSEDMAYKAKSMISPAMAREFCMPGWTEWSTKVRNAGCPIVDMDSDGFIGELIPLWIESGLNVCDPVEVAAHCDINDFRAKFGHQIAYRQGIDKRCMAKGGDVLRDEFRRIEPVVRDGGFIPGCDHGIPGDVSWKNYIQFCRHLAEITGWL